MFLKDRLTKLSLVLIVAALLGILASRAPVPIIGVFLLLIAPLAFVVGVTGLITSFIPARRASIRVIAFILLLPIIGLNTRILVLLQPLAQSVSSVPASALEITVDDWIQLESEEEELAARLRPLAAPEASCGEGCFTVDGFRMPTKNARNEYWWESPEESLLQSGVSLSGVGAPKAYLRVVTTSTGFRRQTIEIELLDAARKRLGFATEEFRTGLPLEPPDGADASGLDYLLHANPIAWLAARFVADSDPYPVHRFVERSVVVNNGDANGIRAITLNIDVDAPVPAYSVERSGEPFEDLIATYTRRSDECDAVFVSRILDERMHRAVLFADRSMRASQCPIIFARDRSGSLIGFHTAQRVAVRCDSDSIYSMTDNIGATMRIVRYDYRGAATMSITAAIKNPRNMLSYTDLGSLIVSANDVSFTRWYWTIRPLEFAKRQDIVLTFPN